MNEYEVFFDEKSCRYSDSPGGQKIKADEINYNLILNKYILRNSKKNKIDPPKFNLDMSDIIKYMQAKTQKIIDEYYTKNNYIEICQPVRTISRLVIGLGEASVREVSIKLDHIYGIPFIPASSIRGAFRSYLNEKFSEVDIDEEEYKEDKMITEIFGNEEKMGRIIFMDIYPKKFQLDVDVMTPHYGDYYKGASMPTDDINPKPINFPVIDTNAEFDIKILCSKEIYKLYNGKNVGDVKSFNVKEEFKSFLAEKPLGAKSSVGYGYFENIK